MKTTINIPDTLMRDVKRFAADRGLTVTEVVISGLRTILAEPPREPIDLPVSPRTGGPLIDLTDRDALWEHAT